VLPSLNWPSAEKVETERRELEAKLTATSEQLAVMQQQSAAVLATLELQSQELQTTLKAMQTTLQDLAQADTLRDADLRRLKEELDNLKNSMPRALEKAKEDQKYALSDLQAELKSLKGLLLNRRAPDAAPGGVTAAGPATPQSAPGLAAAPAAATIASPYAVPTPTAAAVRAPLFAGRNSATTPGAEGGATTPSAAQPTPTNLRAYIPAWQLGGGSGSTAVSAATTPAPSTTTPPPAGAAAAAAAEAAPATAPELASDRPDSAPGDDSTGPAA